MNNKYKEKQAYTDMLNEEFTNAPGAPLGAMSSGPELDKLMRPQGPNDAKFSIYNLFNPKKKKKFESKEEAEAFMKEEPQKWTWEIKESVSVMEYNAELMKSNPVLYKKVLELKENAEQVEYECRAWMNGYYTEAMMKVKSSDLDGEYDSGWVNAVKALEKHGFKDIKIDDKTGKGTAQLGGNIIKFGLGSENLSFDLGELYTKDAQDETVKLIKKFIKDINNWR